MITVRTSSIYTNQNPFWRMRHISFYGILSSSPYPGQKPELVIVNSKKENLPNSGLCRPGRPQSEDERKRKER